MNRLMKRLPPWERRHPQFFASVHIASGLFLLTLTAILYGYQRGGWWRPLLVPAAAGHFYTAYYLHRTSVFRTPLQAERS